MTNTNLYFGLIPLVQTFNNEANQVLALTTGGFGGTLPTGTDFISAGGLKVTIIAHTVGTVANSQQFGSGYGTVATGDLVDITAACTIHATNGQVTMATVAADAVNGFTINTNTTTNNDNMNFVDNAGALAATDTITITHASGKQKEFIEDLMDVVADDNKVKGMVVVRDDMRDLSLPTTRGTVITDVA